MILEQLDTLIGISVVMLGASLLVTILTQMVAGLFGLRGTNLRWALKVLLSTADSNLAAQADQIAQKVLQHPIISDSAFSKLDEIPFLGWLTKRWRLASAIRLEELTNILGDLAGQNKIAGVANITALLQKRDPKAAESIKALAAQLQALAPTQFQQANQMVEQIAGTAQRAVGELQTWFQAAMDRASQRFTLHMRLWTVAFAFVLAFAAHLDSFRLYTQISTNPEMRAQLVASADSMKKIAESQLPQGGGAPAVVLTHAYTESMKKLKEESTQANLGDPRTFASREDAEKWLREQVQDSAAADGLVARYNELVDAELKTSMDRLRDQANSVQAVFQEAKFHLIPVPYHSLDFWPGWDFSNRHFWGILVSAILLSLGAPFWYNALKTLTNLRPLLAKKEEQEKQPSKPK